MNYSPMNLLCFEDVLMHTDWEAKYRSVDPATPVNDSTSITHAADCYVSLSQMDQAVARKILDKYLPLGWKGWPVAVKAAQKRLGAFEQAVVVGSLSDNRRDDNYFGHYFFSHNENGWDVFRQRHTFASLSSPASKFALARHAAQKLWRAG